MTWDTGHRTVMRRAMVGLQAQVMRRQMRPRRRTSLFARPKVARKALQVDSPYGLRDNMTPMASSALPEARDRRRLVLLVDDCLDSREMYAEYLRDEFAIAEAGTGAEAIDQALALLPDVVVMDLTLPGMNGAEASRRLKRDPRTCLIPLLVVSGQQEPEPDAQGKPAWDAFLSKPCRLSVLASAIRQAIDHRPLSTL